MKAEIPRFLIGGTHSGCGKTTVTSAILQAFVNRGMIPAAFKCGPDYIDPMFHSTVIGAPCRNLDLFLCTPDSVRYFLAKNAAAAPIAVMEGVMGYYDGVGGTSAAASACDLAVQTGTPSVLVLSVKGMSLSAAAMVKGYLDFQPNTIQGILLNGVSQAMYPYYQEIIEKNTGVRVYGHLPIEPAAEIGSRHLGLVTAEEITDLRNRLQKLAQLAETCIDLDGLQALAQTAQPLSYTEDSVTPVCSRPVRIGIAKDRAFCFYYADSLDILRQYGAEIIPFSPLTDTQPPHGLDGLYFGGGYPELYAEQLSQNQTMQNALRHLIESGIPTLAECGGFMYLQEAIDQYPMLGVIAGKATLQKKLQNFGYITLTAQRDTLLCKKGAQIRAHEFHYSVSENTGDAFIAQKPLRQKQWNCIHAENTIFAGYPHLHFGANPEFAAQFVRRCAEYRKE